MGDMQPPADRGLHRIYLLVTKAPDGRYCVAYIDGSTERRSYATSADQVIRQAQRAGDIPIRTDDDTIQRRCQDLALPLIAGAEGA